MAQQKIRQFFAQQRYASVEDVLKHIEGVSAEIEAKRRLLPIPSRQKPLSPFVLSVKELALQHLAGHYQRTTIARRILERQGKTAPTMDEVKKMTKKVAHAILVLTQRGEIPRTMVQNKPMKWPKLCKATDDDIRKNKRLIGHVLQKGHRFLPRDWRRYLTWNEADEIGMRGLVNAIETYSPKMTFAFSTYATGQIASAIYQTVRKKRREPALVSFDEKLHGVETAREENRGPTGTKRDIRTVVQALLSRRLASHYIGVAALKLHGHTFQEIAAHIGVRKQAVHNTYVKVIEQIR